MAAILRARRPGGSAAFDRRRRDGVHDFTTLAMWAYLLADAGDEAS
jgi:hypothetical protein